MQCYLCEQYFDCPSGITALFHCPKCKQLIIGDGLDSQIVQDLKSQIDSLNREIHNLNNLINRQDIDLEGKNAELEIYHKQVRINTIGNQAYVQELENRLEIVDKANKELRDFIKNFNNDLLESEPKEPETDTTYKELNTMDDLPF